MNAIVPAFTQVTPKFGNQREYLPQGLQNVYEDPPNHTLFDGDVNVSMAASLLFVEANGGLDSQGNPISSDQFDAARETIKDALKKNPDGPANKARALISKLRQAKVALKTWQTRLGNAEKAIYHDLQQALNQTEKGQFEQAQVLYKKAHTTTHEALLNEPPKQQ